MSPLAVLAFLCSPRVLAGLGNAVGACGAWAFALLAAVAALHWFRGPERRAVLRRAGFPDTLEKSSQALLFPFWAASLADYAGYSFNEVFASWFPPLGFSFLVVLFAGAAATGWRGGWQAACGAFVLSVSAILAFSGALESAPVLATKPSGGVLSACAFFPAVLLGTRLAGPVPVHWYRPPGVPAYRSVGLADRQTRSGLARGRRAVILGASVLAAWAWLFLEFVEPARLADTTLAHMVLARALMGQPGREVAGAMVMAACLGGMAVLMRVLAGWARALPWLRGVKPGRAVVLAVAVLVGVECLALALGFAGDSFTEDCIAGATAAWLFSLGLGMPGLSLKKPGPVLIFAAYFLLSALSVGTAPSPVAALAYAALCAATAGLNLKYRKRIVP